jgi:hypothetical protein
MEAEVSPNLTGSAADSCELSEGDFEQLYWPFIKNMLTSLVSVSFDRITATLSLYCSNRKLQTIPQENLRQFLAIKAMEGTLKLSGDVYSLSVKRLDR